MLTRELSAMQQRIEAVGQPDYRWTVRRPQ